MMATVHLHRGVDFLIWQRNRYSLMIKILNIYTGIFTIISNEIADTVFMHQKADISV